MDDQFKQALAEDKYKEIRKSTNFEKYEGNYVSKHYVDMPNVAIKQTIIKPTKEYMTEYQTKFDEAAKDFWKEVDPKNIIKYQSGEVVCNFNSDSLNINEYFGRIFQMIKESLTMELSQNGQTVEELKTSLELLNLSLKTLAEQTTKIKKDISVRALICFMHGFMNTYIKKNIKGI